MKNYTEKQIEKINKAYKGLYNDDSEENTFVLDEDISLDDKIEELTMFYGAAGFDIKTDDDFDRLLGL